MILILYTVKQMFDTIIFPSITYFVIVVNK